MDREVLHFFSDELEKLSSVRYSPSQRRWMGLDRRRQLQREADMIEMQRGANILAAGLGSVYLAGRIADDNDRRRAEKQASLLKIFGLGKKKKKFRRNKFDARDLYRPTTTIKQRQYNLNHRPSMRSKEGQERLAKIVEAKRARRAAQSTTKSAGLRFFGSAKKTRKLVPVTKVVRGNRTVTVPQRPSRTTENRLASKYLESLGVAR